MTTSRYPLMLAVLCGTTASGQPCMPNWTQVASTGPSARFDHAMAYDSIRQRVVLFGGQAGVTYFNDTWEWDGASWQQRLVSSPPPARAAHVMTFDSARGVVVLFGGRTNTLFNDTWEYDGSNWTQRSTPASPFARFEAGMAFDSANNRCVVFGGRFNSTTGYFGDSWIYDGTTWTQLGTGGPQARSHPGMAFDSDRARVVLYGGSGVLGEGSIVWELNVASPAWFPRLVAPAPTVFFGSAPVMVYDPTRARAVYHSGETAEFDAAGPGRWALRAPQVNPGRSAYAMTFDSQRQRVLLFGGTSSGTPLGDTWQYDPTASGGPVLSTWPGVQTLPYGSTATFRVAATGSGTLTYQWLRNGVPLTDSGQYSGTSTDTLTISPTSLATVAEFNVRVADACGQITTTSGALYSDCIANCDYSTITPVLNVMDFICFDNLFAAGNPRSNCDASTTLPQLNVNDFVCFMNRFAAGCT